MITAEELRNALRYDPETGEFIRLRTSGGSFAGSRAAPNAKGYVKISVNRKVYFAHRLAWLYVYGHFPALHIDHINGNPNDNRIANLRIATRSQNMANRGKNKNNTSGFKGVIRDKGKWRAKIQFANGARELGSFATAEEAHEAYCRAMKETYGPFARVA
jgi:hypothetical protein